MTADPDCPMCHGTGIVNDLVDYGSTRVSMPSTCECVPGDDNYGDPGYYDRAMESAADAEYMRQSDNFGPGNPYL